MFNRDHIKISELTSLHTCYKMVALCKVQWLHGEKLQSVLCWYFLQWCICYYIFPVLIHFFHSSFKHLDILCRRPRHKRTLLQVLQRLLLLSCMNTCTILESYVYSLILLTMQSSFLWKISLMMTERCRHSMDKALIFSFSVHGCHFTVMSDLCKNVLYFCNHFALQHIFLITLYWYMYKINMLG